MFTRIEEAYSRIENIANKTPVITSRTLNEQLKAEIFFKCENLQRIGAFKFRGAYNALSLLTEDEKKRGVITHSSGNHAQAVALASSLLGINSTIVMPENSPQVKKDATAGYGATIVECGNHPDDRTKKAEELIKKHKYILIHPYNDEKIIAGAGTAAYELIKEVGELDYILAPIGGGGLLSGTSIASKGLCPNIKVIGVEPENADDAYRSLRDGKIYPSINPNTMADGLRTSLGDITFKILKENVSEIITISENEIIPAMKFIWERMKLVVEPSGSVPLAGLLKFAKTEKLSGKRIGVILSGGNIDLNPFFKVLQNIVEYDKMNKLQGDNMNLIHIDNMNDNTKN